MTKDFPALTRAISHSLRPFRAEVPETMKGFVVNYADAIAGAGIPAVEIFFAKQHLDWADRAQIAELGHFFRDCDLKVHSVHCPLHTDDVWGRSGPHSIITITEPSKPKRLEMVDEIKRALEIAETVPFRYLIQHIGLPEEEFDERKLDALPTVAKRVSTPQSM